MNTLEEFLKRNRISFNVEKNYRAVNLAFYVDYLADEFIYTSTCIIHNPQSLNIKNTFDLVEKLTPLLHYISSNIKKKI